MITAIANNEVGNSCRTKINAAFTLLNAGIVFGGAGDPSADPGTTVAFYVNTTNGGLWIWFSGAWNFKG